MKKKFTAAERKLLRKDEERLLASIDNLPGDRKLIAEASARQRRRADLKKARVGEVGAFFALNGKIQGAGDPYTEVDSIAGFRTYPVDHDKLWSQLQRAGLADRGLQYDEVPRGRITYEDSSRTFTLFADKCILNNKRLVSQAMSYFSLPSNTKVLADVHYRCPKSIAPRRTKKQEEEDWDI